MKTKQIIVLAGIATVVLTGWLWRARWKSSHGEGDAADLAGRLRDAATSLRQNTDPAQSRQTLADLRARLATRPNSEVVAMLRAALDAGIDAPTHLDLKPRGDGTLADAPSLRVFLLDELRALDPLAARAVARRNLERFTTPDEWAMSFAACATDTSAAGREFVQRKAREMVQHEAWQRQPSAGFLEAFDVLVFTHDTGFVPELAAFLGQTNNRALAYAAFLTLDRLVQTDTAATLNALAAKPELLQGREATRAGYFARADVRNGEQRAVLEQYLLNAARTPGELDRFAGTFPNANFMVSQNLLTRSTTPGAVEISARDAAALGAVNQWLGDSRFAHLKPQLRAIQKRLEQFAKAQ